MTSIQIDPQIEQFWKEYINEIQPAWAKYQKEIGPAQRRLALKHIDEPILGIPYMEFLKDINPAIEHLKQKVADHSVRGQLAALAKLKGWAVEKSRRGVPHAEDHAKQDLPGKTAR